MATRDDLLNTLRRNRTAWYLRRQLNQTQHQVQTVLPQAIQNSEDLAYALGNPALAPDPFPTRQSDEFSGLAISPKWSWINQGSSTAVIRNHSLLLTVPSTGSAATNNVSLFSQTLPWADLPSPGVFSIRAPVQLNSREDNVGGGLYVRCDATGMFTFWSFVQSGAGGGTPFRGRLLQARWSSFSTLVTAGVDLSPVGAGQPVLYLQLRCDGATFYYDISPDNNLYFNVGTSSVSSFGGTPDSFGLGGNAPSSVDAAMPTFRFFRVYYDALLNRPVP